MDPGLRRDLSASGASSSLKSASRRKPGDAPFNVSGADGWIPAFAGTAVFSDGPGFRRDTGLFLWGAGDHGDHWVADVFDIFGQHAGLDRREAGVVEIALDEKGVALI